MSVNSLMTALMNQVRRLKGEPSTTKYSISGATTALSGLSPLPDLSSVNASASDVVAGKKFVDGQGSVVDGTLMNRGAVTQTLTPSSSTYTIPAGYHNGSGTVTAQKQAKSVSFTPNGSAQTINPDSGKFLSSVTINSCGIITLTGSLEITKDNWDSDYMDIDITVSKSDLPRVDVPYYLEVYTDGFEESYPGLEDAPVETYSQFRAVFNGTTQIECTQKDITAPTASNDLRISDQTQSCTLTVTSSASVVNAWNFKVKCSNKYIEPLRTWLRVTEYTQHGPYIGWRIIAWKTA